MIVLRAPRMIDGVGAHPVDDAEIQVDGTTVRYAGSRNGAPAAPPTARLIELPDQTLLPGWIDAHVHPANLWDEPLSTGEIRSTRQPPVFRGRGPGAAESPEVREAIHATVALHALLLSGVTTARDLGSRGTVGMDLRAAANDGVIASPRLRSAGRVVCPTGGHMHRSGIEGDGVQGATRAARQAFKDGADFIKITASGGGGTVGTPMGRPTFGTEELWAIAQEAAQRGSYATAHVHSTEAIVRCLDARVPMLEHATFYDRDQQVRYDPEVGKRILDAGVVVSPTMAAFGRQLERIEAARDTLGPQQAEHWAWVAEGFARRLEIVHHLHELGCPLIIGSDAPACGTPYDDLAFGIQLHVRAGVPMMAAIRSATSLSARAIGVDGVTGSLRAGLDADVIAVHGDPLTRPESVSRTSFVMQMGRVVRHDTVLEPPAAGR